MSLQMIPTDTNEIEMFLHCGRCMDERPDGVSPREWAEFEIGATAHGLQIWCRRHDRNTPVSVARPVAATIGRTRSGTSI